MPRASSTAPGSAVTASAGDGPSGTPGVNLGQGRTAHRGPFLGISACIWPTGTPNTPAIAWSPPRPCLQHGPCALHRARDSRRGLGSSQTLHQLRLPPCPAATGQIICLSQNNIPVVVRERVTARWAGTSICILVGSRTEDLFIFEQDQGKAGTLNHYRACFVAHTITEDGRALPPSPGELTGGLRPPLNHSQPVQEI